jgi:hypothetical protein
VQALARCAQQLSGYRRLRAAAVAAQASSRRGLRVRQLQRALAAAAKVQRWLRRLKATRGAWDAAAAQARAAAAKVRHAREKACHGGARRVQRWFRRRRYFQLFARAVADYLVR